ncbi:MAG: aminotransferase class I/II-fold pyridoxal phosphate-dependent enzyme [Prochlorococcaceae cyanobacterium]
MPISERLGRLGNGVFARNDARKAAYAQRAAAGGLPPLIDLSLGSTDLAPPAVALDAIAAALHRPESAAYCLQAATAPFRRAVATWVERRFGVAVDPEREVLLLLGSQEGTAHLPLAVLDPGDPALLLDPCYPSHRGGLLLAGAEPILLPLLAAEGWRPAFEQLSDSQWDALRLMVLGFPHNPTACTGEQAWLDEAVARACRHDVVIAHDNPYVDLALEGEAPALLRHPRWREVGIEFFTLSKGWCLGGFRLGFAVGAPWLISALAQVKGVVYFPQSRALQAGATAALQLAPDWPAQLLPVYRDRRDRTLAALAAGGWAARPPSMALYLWLQVPPAARVRGLESEAFAAALLEATGVCLTPGNGFGPGGEGWQRLALVHPSTVLDEATARIAGWLASL